MAFDSDESGQYSPNKLHEGHNRPHRRHYQEAKKHNTMNNTTRNATKRNEEIAIRGRMSRQESISLSTLPDRLDDARNNRRTTSKTTTRNRNKNMRGTAGGRGTRYRYRIGYDVESSSSSDDDDDGHVRSISTLPERLESAADGGGGGGGRVRKTTAPRVDAKRRAMKQEEWLGQKKRTNMERRHGGTIRVESTDDEDSVNRRPRRRRDHLRKGKASLSLDSDGKKTKKKVSPSTSASSSISMVSAPVSRKMTKVGGRNHLVVMSDHGNDNDDDDDDDDDDDTSINSAYTAPTVYGGRARKKKKKKTTTKKILKPAKRFIKNVYDVMAVEGATDVTVEGTRDALDSDDGRGGGGSDPCRYMRRPATLLDEKVGGGAVDYAAFVDSGKKMHASADLIRKPASADLSRNKDVVRMIKATPPPPAISKQTREALKMEYVGNLAQGKGQYDLAISHYHNALCTLLSLPLPNNNTPSTAVFLHLSKLNPADMLCTNDERGHIARIASGYADSLLSMSNMDGNTASSSPKIPEDVERAYNLALSINLHLLHLEKQNLYRPTPYKACMILNEMGRIHCAMGRYDPSMVCYRDMNKLIKKSWKTPPTKTTTTNTKPILISTQENLHNKFRAQLLSKMGLGNVHHKTKKHIQSIECFKECFLLQNQWQEEEAPKTVGNATLSSLWKRTSHEHSGLLTNVGMSYSHMGRYQEAITCYEKALQELSRRETQTRSKNNDDDHQFIRRLIDDILAKMGRTYHKMKLYDKAELFLTRALESKEKEQERLYTRHFQNRASWQRKIGTATSSSSSSSRSLTYSILTLKHELGLVQSNLRKYDSAITTLKSIYHPMLQFYGHDDGTSSSTMGRDGTINMAKLVVDLCQVDYIRCSNGETLTPWKRNEIRSRCVAALEVFSGDEEEEGNLKEDHAYVRQVTALIRRIDHEGRGKNVLFFQEAFKNLWCLKI